MSSLPIGTLSLPLVPATFLLDEKYKVGIYAHDSYYKLLKEYFSIWGTTIEHTETFDECKKMDFIFVNNDLEFAFKLLRHRQNKKKKSTSPFQKTLVLFTSLSSLSAVTNQIRDQGFEKQVLIVTKPLGPLKLYLALKLLFEQNYHDTAVSSSTSLSSILLSMQSGSTLSDSDNLIISSHTSDEPHSTQGKFKKEKRNQQLLERHVQQLKQGDVTESNAPIELLVVEDNPVNQMVMRSQLGKLGVSYRITPSGEQGVEIWRNSPTNVPMIFMDIEVDGPIDGLEATTQIRALEKKRDEENRNNKNYVPHRTYIAAMTGRSLEEDQVEVLRSGCDEYLVKPVRLDKVMALVKDKIKSNSTPNFEKKDL